MICGIALDMEACYMHMLRGLGPMCPIDHNCCQWRSEETVLYAMKRTCSRLGCKALSSSEDGLNAVACMEESMHNPHTRLNDLA